MIHPRELEANTHRVGAAAAGLAAAEHTAALTALELTDPRRWASLEWIDTEPSGHAVWPRAIACRWEPPGHHWP